MCAPMSIRRGTQLASELDRIQRRSVILRLLHIIGNECIKNRKNLSASVTLCQQGDENLLGHNEEEK